MSDLQADSYSEGVVTGSVCTSCEFIDGVAYVEAGILPYIGAGDLVTVDGESYVVAATAHNDKMELTLVRA